MPEKINCINSEDQPVEYIPQESPENNLFTKAIRKRLVIQAKALMRSTIMAVFCWLGLNLASNSKR